MKRLPRRDRSLSVRALAVDLSERDKDALREYVKSP